MAITGPIPLPGTGMDAFLNELQRGQENKLKSAQREALMGKAAQSKMLADLINRAMGGAGSSGAGTMQGGASGVNAPLLTSGLLGLPTHAMGGNIITPFGSVKVGESPTEEGQRKVGEALQTKQGETNITSQADINKHVLALNNLKNIYNRMNSLLEKRPSLTGPLAGRMGESGLSSDDDLAAFQVLSKKAQAELGKLATSSKAGIGSINWAGTGKPSTKNPGKYNVGMINQGLKDIEDEIATLQGHSPSNEKTPEVAPEVAPERAPIVAGKKGRSGAPSLSNGIKFPKFNSKAEFQEWFSAQPPVVQHAVTLHLHSKRKK